MQLLNINFFGSFDMLERLIEFFIDLGGFFSFNGVLLSLGREVWSILRKPFFFSHRFLFSARIN